MPTCRLHQWNLPCSCCAMDARHQDERQARIWQMGYSMAVTSLKPLPHLKHLERLTVTVPEIDPRTMVATGRRKEYGYVDLPVTLTGR